MEIEIRCSCGRGLDDSVESDNRHNVFCEIELCPDCLKEAVEEAKKESYDEGYAEGVSQNE